jgi:hypothetical protein
VPTRIWRDFMIEVLDGQPVTPLELEPEPTDQLVQDAAPTPAAPQDAAIVDAEARDELDALLERFSGL